MGDEEDDTPAIQRAIDIGTPIIITRRVKLMDVYTKKIDALFTAGEELVAALQEPNYSPGWKERAEAALSSWRRVAGGEK